MAVPALWCALLVLAVVPYLVGLPGAGVLDTLTSLGTQGATKLAFSAF